MMVDQENLELVKIDQSEIKEVLEGLTKLRKLLNLEGSEFGAGRILTEAIAKIKRLDSSLEMGDLMDLRNGKLPEIRAAITARRIDPIKYVENLLEPLAKNPDYFDFSVRKEAFLLVGDLMRDGVFNLNSVQFSIISMWTAYLTLESTDSEKVKSLSEQLLTLFSEIRIQPATELESDKL